EVPNRGGISARDAQYGIRSCALRADDWRHRGSALRDPLLIVFIGTDAFLQDRRRLGIVLPAPRQLLDRRHPHTIDILRAAGVVPSSGLASSAQRRYQRSGRVLSGSTVCRPRPSIPAPSPRPPRSALIRFHRSGRVPSGSAVSRHLPSSPAPTPGPPPSAHH